MIPNRGKPQMLVPLINSIPIAIVIVILVEHFDPDDDFDFDSQQAAWD